MIKFSVKTINFKYLDYYNKLVLNKNLQNIKTKSNKNNIKIQTNKKKSSNMVTLRAPKHFKIGRHHYQTISKYYFLLFKNFKLKINTSFIYLYKYIKILVNLIKNKKISKLLSVLTSIKLTVVIETNFILL